MKYKYVYAKEKLLIEEECINFLEEMSRKGWKLKNIVFSFFKFEKCEQPLKYQLDYSEFDEEYINVIKELGYEYICLYYDISFYCHKDLTVIDLQTDSEAHKLSILNHYKSANIIRSFIVLLGIIIMSQMNSGSPIRDKTLADFYMYFNNEVSTWGCYIAGFYLVLKIIQVIDIRYRINHNQFERSKLICFHPIYRILHFISLSLCIVILLFLLCFEIQILYILLIISSGCLIITLSRYLLDKNRHRNNNSKSRKVIIKIVGYSIGIVGFILIASQNFLITHLPHNINDSKPYHQYINIKSNKESNLFLTHLSFYEDFLSEVYTTSPRVFQSENYYIARDNNIANIIFKQLIIDRERTLNDNITDDDYTTINGESYSYTKYKYKSFEEALQLFSIYPTSYTQKCYYYNNFMLAIKDNQILECTIKDKDDINNILKYYFE